MIIDGLGLSQYKSFGKEVQKIGPFKKINFFIGKNNSGKSNILRFLVDHYEGFIGEHPAFKFKDANYDKPLNFSGDFIIESGLTLNGENHKKLINNIKNSDQINDNHIEIINKIINSKTLTQDTELAWFRYKGELGKALSLDEDVIDDILEVLHEKNYYRYLHHICNAISRIGANTDKLRLLTILNKLSPIYNSGNSGVYFLPEIREFRKGEDGITNNDSFSRNTFNGLNIIDELAELQNPSDLTERNHKLNKFNGINVFLREVTGDKSAKINIPNNNKNIFVFMDKKTLPLESLGTGIHEIIIIAVACTTIENQIICIEEPELHLHPLLQKKLIYYLLKNTENQYFISTHSAHLLDIPDSAIFHVSLENGHSIVNNATSDTEKSTICKDLGYKASDLLQSNCIIWVEGPSDRIYLNYWIKEKKPEFIEGIHYSIMTYGGKLLSHLTTDDIEIDDQESLDKEIDDFISLRRLNRNISIIIDRDRDGPDIKINSTKERVQNEINKGDGFAWITFGREIENYIDTEIIREVVNSFSQEIASKLKFGTYKNCLKYTKNRKTHTVNKVKVAKAVTSKYKANFNTLDLEKQMKKLIKFISDSNDNFYFSE